MLNPILYWTDADIWTYTRSERLPYCRLYDEGFARLGCIGCPMARLGRQREFARWPRYEAAWRRAVTDHWNKWHGVPKRDGNPKWFDQADSPIHSADDLWRWWMEELPEPDDDDCQMGLF